MKQHIAVVRSLLKDRRGVTALEYGLIATFIAVGLIAVLPGVGTKLNAAFQKIVTALT